MPGLWTNLSIFCFCFPSSYSSLYRKANVLSLLCVLSRFEIATSSYFSLEISHSSATVNSQRHPGTSRVESWNSAVTLHCLLLQPNGWLEAHCSVFRHCRLYCGCGLPPCRAHGWDSDMDICSGAEMHRCQAARRWQLIIFEWKTQDQRARVFIFWYKVCDEVGWTWYRPKFYDHT